MEFEEGTGFWQMASSSLPALFVCQKQQRASLLVNFGSGLRERDPVLGAGFNCTILVYHQVVQQAGEKCSVLNESGSC